MSLPKRIKGEPAPVVFSYLRFSTPDQIEGDSISRQTEKTRRWAERHNLPIDETLDFRDLGVSAFRGRNAKTGAFALVIEAIETGKIWPGCFLSMESLDRATRQKPMEALSLIQAILKAQVRIVTHSPSERIYTEESADNTYSLIEMILTFARSHEESQLKSKRLQSSWSNKRKEVAEDGKKLTAIAPAWLDPVRAQPTRRNPRGEIIDFRVNKKRAAIVKRIYKLAIDGHGATSITRQLNADDVEPFGSRKRNKSGRWGASSVKKILDSRATVGDFQPHRLVHDDDGQKARVADGDPIKGYYPAVIDEQTYHRAQAAIRDRKLPRGKATERVTNLFTGLVYDVRTGGTMTTANKGAKSSGVKLVSSDAVQGAAEYLSFPYDTFEALTLALISEIDFSALMPQATSRIGREIIEHEEEEAALNQQRLELKETIKGRKTGIASIAELLVETDEKLQQVRDQIESLRRQQASAAEDNLCTTQKLITRLAKAKPSEALEIRTKMRTCISRFVDRITVFVAEVNNDRVLMADVALASGQHRKLVMETGTPAPDEFYKLDVHDFDQWPDEFKATRFEVVPEIEKRILKLDDQGTLIQYIAEEVGVSQTKVSRVLTKHSRRRITNRKPKDSSVLMTWNKSSKGWQKTKDKQRYYIGCGELKKLYPRLVKSLDRKGTLKAANRWWTEKLREIGPA